MNREQALRYVGYCIDDALSEHEARDMPSGVNARLIGWQCGFEPMFVAVWSYLGVPLDDEEATEIAVDLLEEKHWFVPGQSHEPDYIL